MKKLLFTFLGIAVIFSLAFKNNTTPKPMLNHKSDKWGEWGPWKTTSCYKGLDFRVRRTQEDSFNGPKYEWEAQFRNRYEDQISFNFKITEPGDESETGDRQSISANGSSNGEDWALTTNAYRCEVLVDKVRFGDDDASKPYIECGN